MKYLKMFENDFSDRLDSLNKIYKVGDYVYITPTLFKDKQMRAAKITMIDNTQRKNGFEVTLITGETIWIYNSLIVKSLTPEEIEKFELESVSNKYNL